MELVLIIWRRTSTTNICFNTFVVFVLLYNTIHVSVILFLNNIILILT